MNEQEERDRALQAPWWGSCGACGPGTAWFGDSEEQVRGLVEEHVKTGHVQVWQAVPTPNSSAASS